MIKSKLNYREENISLKEKRTLLFRFFGVLLFGLGIASVAYYFVIFTSNSDEIPIPVIIFAVFFFGVLAFILFVHGRNAFQSSKIIYTGEITNKFQNTTAFRNSTDNSTYHISLDGEDFMVDLYFYNKVQKGEKVELHCFKNNSVFDVKHISAQSETNFQPNEYAFQHPKYQETTESNFSDSEFKAILKGYFIRALIFRFLIVGGFISVFGFFALVFILLQKFPANTVITLIQATTLVSITIWILANLKTYRILKDMMNGVQIEKIEKVIDLQVSNMPKPSKNSIQSYRNYNSRDVRFYYVETTNHWISIDEEKYNALKSGDDLKIVMAKNSKVVIGVVLCK